MSWQVSNAQDVGGRKRQEDSFSSFEHKGCIVAVVADGVGGAARGDLISKLAVRSFCSYLRNQELAQPTADLQAALQHANSEVARAIDANSDLTGGATTLIGVILAPKRISYISVGDSPLYLLRKRKLQRVNASHSLTPEDGADRSNVITSYIAGESIPLIDSNGLSLQQGDLVVLASDGVHTLSDVQLERQLLTSRKVKPLARAQQLIDAVLAAGAHYQDNTTVILLINKSHSSLRYILAAAALLALLVGGLAISYCLYPQIINDIKIRLPSGSEVNTSIDSNASADANSSADSNASTDSYANGAPSE